MIAKLINLLSRRRRKIYKKHLNNLFVELLSKESDLLNYFDAGCSGGIDSRWSMVKDHLLVTSVDADARGSVFDEGEDWSQTLLGSKNDKVSFYLTAKQECSSIYKPNEEITKLYPEPDRFIISRELQNQNMVSLDSIVNGNIDFIKADVQGAELDVLKGSGPLIDDLLGLEVEVEFVQLYSKQPRFNDVNEWLESNSLELNDFLHTYRWSRDEFNDCGKLIFADCLYLRSPEYVLQNDLNWKKYLLICVLYKRYDLVDVILKQKGLMYSDLNHLKRQFEFEKKVYRRMNFISNSLSETNFIHLTY